MDPCSSFDVTQLTDSEQVSLSLSLGRSLSLTQSGGCNVRRRRETRRLSPTLNRLETEAAEPPSGRGVVAAAAFDVVLILCRWLFVA